MVDTCWKNTSVFTNIEIFFDAKLTKTENSRGERKNIDIDQIYIIEIIPSNRNEQFSCHELNHYLDPAIQN